MVFFLLFLWAFKMNAKNIFPITTSQVNDLKILFTFNLKINASAVSNNINADSSSKKKNYYVLKEMNPFSFFKKS